jgi:transposase
VSDDRAFAVVQMKPDYRAILEYLNRINSQHGGKCKFVCGYEAGCLGYSLYHQLTRKDVDCVILAPSTMPITPGKKIKTDKRDAEKIARCLAYHSYSPVYIPDEEDNAVKEYIRMRDDGVAALKRVKQQIIALYTRNGKMFDGKNYWTRSTWIGCRAWSLHTRC